jgi:hypothetical protein
MISHPGTLASPLGRCCKLAGIKEASKHRGRCESRRQEDRYDARLAKEDSRDCLGVVKQGRWWKLDERKVRELCVCVCVMNDGDVRVGTLGKTVCMHSDEGVGVACR